MQICYFNSMHPGGDIDLSWATTDNSTFAAARSTVDIINGINGYVPTNSLSMAWVPSARVVSSTTFLLGKFEQAWSASGRPNFVPVIGGGCSLENAGATAAVSDLLASVHGHEEGAALLLFPGGWPEGEHVSFGRLRVQGAFLVAANATGRGDGLSNVDFIGGVTIDSLAGQSLTLGWRLGTPKVRAATGGAVSVSPAQCDVPMPCFRFGTAAGVQYSISAG